MQSMYENDKLKEHPLVVINSFRRIADKLINDELGDYPPSEIEAALYSIVAGLLKHRKIKVKLIPKPRPDVKPMTHRA